MKRSPALVPLSHDHERASSELNVTEVSWKAGNGPPVHVNEERDVLIVVLDGAAIVSVDHVRHELGRGETAIIPKGERRRITAGRDGVRYLSVHRRRPPPHAAMSLLRDERLTLNRLRSKRRRDA